MGATRSTGVSEEAARSWRLLAERLERETDERVRANLEIVARHVVLEVGGDLDELMETLVPDPHYVFLGNVAGATAPIDLHGPEAVRAMYEGAIAQGGNRLEFELSRVVADTGGVVTEGDFRQAYYGGTILQLGVETGVEIDADTWYLVTYPALVVWPVSDDGLIEGERVYFGDVPRVVRALEPGEFPHLGPVDRSAVGPGSSSPALT